MTGTSNQDLNMIMMLKTTLWYYNLYYELWPSLVAVTLSQVGQSTVQHFRFKEMTIQLTVANFFLEMTWLLFALFVAHICITKAGFLYADAEVLQDQLPDQMEEGLIIIDAECDKVYFQNESAKKMGQIRS